MQLEGQTKACWTKLHPFRRLYPAPHLAADHSSVATPAPGRRRSTGQGARRSGQTPFAAPHIAGLPVDGKVYHVDFGRLDVPDRRARDAQPRHDEQSLCAAARSPLPFTAHLSPRHESQPRIHIGRADAYWWAPPAALAEPRRWRCCMRGGRRSLCRLCNAQSPKRFVDEHPGRSVAVLLTRAHTVQVSVAAQQVLAGGPQSGKALRGPLPRHACHRLRLTEAPPRRRELHRHLARWFTKCRPPCSPAQMGRPGHVSLISSVAGSGPAKEPAYGPTKAALINLAEALYLDPERTWAWA